MNCPKCGTENKPKFKFCVKCGSNLENPSDVNIEQVDMGGYHTEESPESSSFKLGSGTFKISDRAPETASSLFTADELNDTDEDFDFSSLDEPFIPSIDASRVAVPSVAPPQPQSVQPQMNQNAYNPAYGYPQQPVQPNMQQPVQPNPQQPVNNMNPYANQMYGNQPAYGGQPMMMQPQIVGYDQNGMPIYSQPQQVMYAPPQIVGYDQNGMPIYSQPQPIMYAPPQIVGYDQNGMPIYSQPQPMIYAPPAVNEMGEPISPANPAYPMPQTAQPYPQAPPPMNMQGYAVPPQPNMYGAPPVQPVVQQPVQPAPVQQQPAKQTHWNDDDDDQDDFFSQARPSGDMGSVSAESVDINRLKRHERKKNAYMTDTPMVSADTLQPNKGDELNKMYMRKAQAVNAEALEQKTKVKTQDYMAVTEDVSSAELDANEQKKTRITMKQTGSADASQLDSYRRTNSGSTMAQADRAVEALPKAKRTENDEIDSIELPEFMQARKTVNSNIPTIPELPKL